MAESQSNVEYRRLGNSGLKVSVPILGCMSYGSSEWLPYVINEEQALPILKAAYDKGINTWDTANAYSNGESERIIGKALKKFGIPRERVVIMTKCYAAVADTPGEFTWRAKDVNPKYINNLGLSRKAIFSAVEKSLERLGTDYIDLLQIHRFDYETPPEETMEALHDLVKSGKVRYIGASSMHTYQFQGMQHIADLKGYTKFISMQNHYSLLYREEEREMNAYCKNTGVGLIPWSPLARGHLARPPNPTSSSRMDFEKTNPIYQNYGATEADQTIIRRVEEIANKKGWKMATVALLWICARVSSPIVGAGSLERVESLLDITGKKLTAEEEKYLEEAYVPRPILGHQ
ncbi:hypothetical protein RUND412_005716 [Rhizina undulata]